MAAQGLGCSEVAYRPYTGPKGILHSVKNLSNSCGLQRGAQGAGWRVLCSNRQGETAPLDEIAKFITRGGRAQLASGGHTGGQG